MKSWIAAGAALIFTGSVAAGAPGWTEVAANASRTAVKEIKDGSFEVSQNKSNEEIAVVTGRTLSGSQTSPSIALEKWYVRTGDCQRGEGKIVTLRLDGEFKYDNDFLLDGGTVASGVAEIICLIHTRQAENRRKKSL